jgi:hypothetical protein
MLKAIALLQLSAPHLSSTHTHKLGLKQIMVDKRHNDRWGSSRSVRRSASLRMSYAARWTNPPRETKGHTWHPGGELVAPLLEPGKLAPQVHQPQHKLLLSMPLALQLHEGLRKTRPELHRLARCATGLDLQPLPNVPCALLYWILSQQCIAFARDITHFLPGASARKRPDSALGQIATDQRHQNSAGRPRVTH